MILADLLLQNVRLRPDAPALQYHDTTWSFDDLNRRVNQWAHALHGLGVEKGHRVSILGKNSADYIALYFANGKIGGVTTPLNYRLTPEELQYIINDARATTLLFEHEFAETVLAMAPELDTVEQFVCMDGAPGAVNGVSAHDGPALVAAADTTEPESDIDEDDLIWQMYTSGTTGHPKGAMITNRNIITNVISGIVEIPLSPTHTYLIPAPTYHAAAVIAFTTSYARGARVVLTREFNPQEVLTLIPQERITHALFVPAMIIFLLSVPGVDKTDFSSLELILYGASPIPLDVLKKALATFQCGFYQAFGQTESTALLTHLGPDDHDPDGPHPERLASAGRENFGVEIRVVDDNDVEVPRGEMGEIIARTESVMRGYWNMPEATDATLKGGWLHTGDLGYMDEHRYIYIVDRKKDMIISGGENIYPREIEEVLYTHPAVADAAVIGIPDDRWGEAVHAVIVRKPDTDIDSQAVTAFCREHLAGYKCPRTVEFIEELPRNQSGKVLKKELRAPYWEDATRGVN